MIREVDPHPAHKNVRCFICDKCLTDAFLLRPAIRRGGEVVGVALIPVHEGCVGSRI